MLEIIFLTIIAVLVVVIVIGFLKEIGEPSERKRHPIYLKDHFFSHNEYRLYQCLDKITQEMENADLFAKTRWEDIWNAERGTEHERYRGFLKSRHIDFLLLDSETGKVRILIELTDSSHERPDRVKRNKRLEQFCEDTRTRLLWIKTRSHYDTENIKEQIEKCLDDKASTICHA